MKCPLLHHKEHNPDVFPGETFEDCLKEECAWWQPEHGHCAVLACQEAADKLAKTLKDIASKIPLGGVK